MKRKKLKSFEKNDDDNDNELLDAGLKVSKLHRVLPHTMNVKKSIRDEIIKKENLELSEGLFNAQEDEIIIQNFSNFCSKFGIEDTNENRKYLLGFYHSSKDPAVIEERRRFNQLSKQNYFNFHLAQRLDKRTISQVYQRARKILSPFKKQSELSKNEKAEIIKYYKGSKKKLIEIGSCYEADNRALYQLIRNKVDGDTKKSFRKGRWDLEEEIKLAKAVKETLKKKNLKDCLNRNIDWTTISKKIKTRSGARCQRHWFKQVALKLPLMEELLKKHEKSNKKHKDEKNEEVENDDQNLDKKSDRKRKNKEKKQVDDVENDIKLEKKRKKKKKNEEEEDIQDIDYVENLGNVEDFEDDDRKFFKKKKKKKKKEKRKRVKEKEEKEKEEENEEENEEEKEKEEEEEEEELEDCENGVKYKVIVEVEADDEDEEEDEDYDNYYNDY